MPTLPDLLTLQITAGGPGSGRHAGFGQAKRIAIDFDGVIHRGGGNSNQMGPPVKGALAGIKALQKAGMEVVIHSARPASMIHPWLKQHGFPDLKVTNKKPVARAYLDDRAVPFKQWDKATLDKVSNFKPYWEKDIHSTSYGPQTGTVNWTSPSEPQGQDWYEVYIGISPIPHDHAPSVKNPMKTKIPTAQDGWHKKDSKAAKKQARKDLVILHRQMRRQYGKPEIAETANFPLYPTLQSWQ